MAYDHKRHGPNDDRLHTVSPFRVLLDLRPCYSFLRLPKYIVYDLADKPICFSTLTCDAGEPTMTLRSLVSIDYYKGAIDFWDNPRRHYDTTPEDVIFTFCFGAPDSVPTPSMALTTSMPSITSPNTTCRSSSHDVTTVVIKN